MNQSFLINQPSAAWARQRRLMELPRSLMGGSLAMRAAGRKYLSRKAAETEADYQDRLKGAVLKNYFSQTVDYLAGQVFQKPLDYLPPGGDGGEPYETKFFEAFKENVDLSGSSLSVFGLDLFKDALIDGLSFLLVDYSRQPDDSPRTVAAARAGGWRPYFVKIPAGHVLDAWLETRGGGRRLGHFRYLEKSDEADPDNPFARREVLRIRAFWPGRWEIWETRDQRGPILADQGTTSLDYIPVFWFRPGAEGPEGLTAEPPLSDLAEMNRAHWEAASHHQVLMKWNRSPVWLGINLAGPEGQELEFGPSRFICAATGPDSPAPDLRSVGVSPDSVDRSLADLARMERDMRDYGLTVALSPAGYATATEVATAAQASDSQLKGWCVAFQDFLENALAAAAEYHGWPDGPAVFVNTSFRRNFDGPKAEFLKACRDNGNLSLSTFLSEIKQMGAVSDEMSITKEIQRLTKESNHALENQ